MADDEATAGGGPGRRRTTKATGGAAKKAAGARVAKAASAPLKKAAPAKRAAVATRAAGSAAAAGRPSGTRSVRKAPSAAGEKAASVGKAARANRAAAAEKETPRKTVTRRIGAGPASGILSAREAPPRFGRSRLAAEQTFDEKPVAPAPKAPVDDPASRARALLRSAAAGLRTREAGTGSWSATGYPAPPVEPVEAPPETLIAPERRLAPRPAPERPPIAPPAPAPATATRRLVLQPQPEPEPEPEWELEDDPEPESEIEAEAQAEWAIEDQPLDEEPEPDRIPDAMDVLSVAGTTGPSRRTSTRRFPPPAPPEAPRSVLPPPPPPPSASPATASPATVVMEQAPAADEPPPWIPSPPVPPTTEKSGGAGLSVVAIVLSLVVPVIGAIAGLVLATRARKRNLPLAGLARVVALVALLVWVAAGVAVVATRDQGVDYSKLRVGDCFNSSATNEVRGITVIPCSKSHNSEVFFLVAQPAGPGDPYPGKDQLVQFAADACLGKPLTDYLGMPLEQSKLKDFEIVPQESAWKDGRRLLVCGIDTGGQGRVAGSARAGR